MTNRITRSVLAVTLLFSVQAHAHFPLMNCWFDAAKNVVCEAGYSDASKAVDYTINLYDYDDNLVDKAQTNKASQVIFNQPKGDFYIVFDAGHESPVEVDVVEIKQK